MKKALTLALLAASALTGATAAMAEEHELSNGTVVNTPFEIQHSQTAIVFGLTRKGGMNDFLNNGNVELMPIPCQPKLGLTAVFAQNIHESEAGAYNEIVSTMFVQRKGAPDLPLTCLADTDQLSAIDFIVNSLFTMVAANQANLEAGLPLDYGMYTQSLIVSTEDAQLAGLEVWGFPKAMADIGFSITATDFSFESTDPLTGREVMTFTTPRITAGTGMTPFGLNGDFFVPERYSPDGKLSQLNGILGTKADTLAYMYPFTGQVTYGQVGQVTNDVARYLSEGQWAPALVVDFDHVEALFYNNRPK